MFRLNVMSCTIFFPSTRETSTKSSIFLNKTCFKNGCPTVKEMQIQGYKHLVGLMFMSLENSTKFGLIYKELNSPLAALFILPQKFEIQVAYKGKTI